MLTLQSVKCLTSGPKKYEAIFLKDRKEVRQKFGAAGYSDFTKHKDKKRRESYIRRHRKDLQTRDPTRAGYLSMFLLWNKTTLKESIKNYRKRLAIFNKGKPFPTQMES